MAYTAIEMRVGKVLKAASRDTCSWGISFSSPSVSVSWDLRFFPRLVEYVTARSLTIDLQIKKAATGLMSRSRQQLVNTATGRISSSLFGRWRSTLLSTGLNGNGQSLCSIWLGTSPASPEKSRYRITFQFGMESEESLSLRLSN